jgi:hypothetical protein
LLAGLRGAGEFPVLPVYYGPPGPSEDATPEDLSIRQVVFGEELPPEASAEEIRKTLEALAAHPPVELHAVHH